MKQFLIYYERHCCLVVVYCSGLCALLCMQVCVFLPTWFYHQYIFCFHSLYLHFNSAPGAFITKRSMHRNQLWLLCYWMQVIFDPSYTVWLHLCIWMTHWRVSGMVSSETLMPVLTASWLVPVTQLFRDADLCVFQSRFQYETPLDWRSSPACLTSVDFITGGVMNAAVLCCSCVSTKKGFRQVLQTVAQCTETAGAAHQGSVEMTSPDKCRSDSSPSPTPPPQAPWHVLNLVQATRPDRTGRLSQSCGHEVR